MVHVPLHISSIDHKMNAEITLTHLMACQHYFKFVYLYPIDNHRSGPTTWCLYSRVYQNH